MITKKKYSEKAKLQMSFKRKGVGNPFFGKKHSEETKRRMSEARKGKRNSFFGKKHSEDTKQKLSKILQKQFKDGRKSPTDGTKRSEITKKKISETRVKLGIAKGKNNPRWIDGKNRTRKDLRRNEMETTKYKNWRKSVFERDNFTCVKCNKRGGDLQADHIKPWAHYPNLRYRLSNGRTLCVGCHRKTFKDMWR